MTQSNVPDGDSLISRDGVLIGPILGIHRDPVSRAALWAVVEGAERRLVVPLHDADSQPGVVQVAHDADQVLTSPEVADPTNLLATDEGALSSHYRTADSTGRPMGPVRAPQPPGAIDDAAPPPPEQESGEPAISMVRSEEQLSVRSLEWRPYQRVRLRTVVRSREETHVVQVRWEELVVENEPVSAVERLEVTSGLAPADSSDVELVLHREEVTVTTRVVPYEWVRATRSPVSEEVEVTGTVRREMIDVQHERVEPNGSSADARPGGKP